MPDSGVRSLVGGDAPNPPITPSRLGGAGAVGGVGPGEPLTLTPSWELGEARAKFSTAAGPRPEPCYCICWVGEFVGWESSRNETQVGPGPGSLTLHAGGQQSRQDREGLGVAGPPGCASWPPSLRPRVPLGTGCGPPSCPLVWSAPYRQGCPIPASLGPGTPPFSQVLRPGSDAPR